MRDRDKFARIISAITVLFILAGAIPSLALATSGDAQFLEVDYLPGVDIPATMIADDAGDTVRQLVNNLATIVNAEGATALPAGVVCDTVTIARGQMTIALSAPAGADLNEMAIEEASEIVRYHFAEALGIDEITFTARVGDDTVYHPVAALALPPETFGQGEAPCEEGGPGPQPAPDYSTLYRTTDIAGQGPIGTSGQPIGALAGRTVFFSPGHGWYYTGSQWSLMRPLLLMMNEDHGNLDQGNFFAAYLLNAGATVVPMRPMGQQENEVVLDNVDAGVTFSGNWTVSTNQACYGSTVEPYRYTDTAPTETATATYTPNIPEAGFYPVYCWANYASDRTSGQLYIVNHSAGQSRFRINHRRVGRGWIWLGNYYFEAGSHPDTGSVVISNLAPAIGTTTGLVIADAIRFGNGPGDVDRGGGISGFARETECSRYWIQRMVRANGPSTIYDVASLGDSSDNVGAPSRMAAEMRNEDGQGYNGDIYLGFHSNASSGAARGCVGLITNSSAGTPVNQAAYATLLANEIDNDCLIEDANWTQTWVDRSSATYTGTYGEISAGSINSEMCSTIIEVAFHDNVQDAELLRDPRVRNVLARACYQAIVRYFNTYDGNTLAFIPEPPTHLTAKVVGSGQVVLTWEDGPSGGAGGDAPNAYRIYTSPDGLNFSLETGSQQKSVFLSVEDNGGPHYFRVSATNAGGESLPSEVVAVGRPTAANSRVLVVNGFDRLDGSFDIPEYPNNAADDRCDRVLTHRTNSYDFIRQHAEAIVANNIRFDSCANEAVTDGDVDLASHKTVIWILGEESTQDHTFTSAEQALVTTFLNGGGNLFVSGSEIGWDLDAQNNGRTFFRNTLHGGYTGDDGNAQTANGTASELFDSIALTLDDSSISYDVDSPDILSTANGATALMTYGGSGGTSEFVEDFDEISEWRDPNYSGQTNADASSTFTLAASPTHQGSGSGDLYYVWGTGDFIREYNGSQPQFPADSDLSVWVHGDNSGDSLRIAIRDSDNEIYVNDYTVINFTGWREITWNDIQSNPGSVWALPNNSVIDGPTIGIDSFQISRTGTSTSGHLYFDDMTHSVEGGGGSGDVAALEWSGGTPSRHVIMLGFPFEAITSEQVRTDMMGRVLTAFGHDISIDGIVTFILTTENAAENDEDLDLNGDGTVNAADVVTRVNP